MASSVTKEQRIAHIVDLMARGLWVTAVTYNELSEKFKVHPQVIREDAAEASRLISMHVRSDKRIADRLHVVLEQVAHDAELIAQDPEAGPNSKILALKAKVEAVKAMTATDTTMLSISRSTGRICRALEKALPADMYERALDAISRISDGHADAVVDAATASGAGNEES